MRLLYTFYQQSPLLLVLFLLAGLSGRAQNGGVTTTQSFTYTGQIETWTVPAGVTSLTIEARGAEGGFGPLIFGGDPNELRPAGKGALIQGTVSVSGGQVLKILVGQKSPNRNGGGGGSFVTTIDNAPLLIAGGGGGSGSQPDQATKDGQTGRTGGANGGSNGQGGKAINGAAAGGGGLLTDGISSTVNGNGETSQGGKAFVNGGAGSRNNDSFGLGGFGGGGSGTGVGSGGGGGGYSGGGGGGGSTGPGGGGASYYEPSTLLSAVAGANTGNGQVIITYVVPSCPPLTITRQPASASTVCAGSPVSTFVTVDGSPTTYQWYRGSTLLSNQTSATLTLASAQAGDAGSYSVVVSSDCRSLTSTAFNLTVNPLPPAPTLLTQSGQSYPGGQSSVSVDVNSGNVNLVVGGCNGTISWRGPNGSSGNSSPITVATDQVGQFVYMASCTVNGCASPAASATVTVQARLSVLHRDVDNYADNNAVQPLLQLQNNGTGPLPYSALTLRYYLTVEGDSPLSNLFVNYAQVGNQNVRLQYVSLVPVRVDASAMPLPPARQGATGYVEVSFTPAAGSLAPGANSGNLQLYFAKADYGALNELDDYSYAQLRDQLVNNPRITAYYNGTLVAGTEPGEVAANLAVQALTESKNGPSANQINTYLVIRNTGNVAIPYSSLRARYYFNSDNNQTARVELDEGAAAVRVVKLPAPAGGADSYIEVRYTDQGLLMPGSSTGRVRYRVLRSDDGRFDQTNDYSYQERPEALSPNNRVTVLVFNRLTWGTPPAGAPARIGVSQEPGSGLKVDVLGNPLRDELVRVEISGSGSEPLQLQLINAQGRVITTRQIATPQPTEQQEFSVAGQGPGVLLLQVSTPTQRQTVRVLKAE
ncbi:cellulose binding domain-containing protein [Fibrella forsythiae]|uniref:Ig-like domain-containing protein n=1 Tax=Fibrella forsythiae TaxID=2817061 RepID=A0ABS3JW84_9BACT|nr:cellulose binding domain-containing protein [Fibrella forsythiae]MBO0953162.1 hypothetical protein [Fibrella forsythiae]